MDFKYPFPDWLKNMVTMRENAILQLDTNSGLVGVKPGQWVVKDSRDNLHINLHILLHINLHILDPEEFHRRYEAVSD